MIDVLTLSVTRVGEVAVFSRDVRGRTVVKLQGACARVSRDRPGGSVKFTHGITPGPEIKFRKNFKSKR